MRWDWRVRDTKPTGRDVARAEIAAEAEFKDANYPLAELADPCFVNLRGLSRRELGCAVGTYEPAAPARTRIPPKLAVTFSEGVSDELCRHAE